MMVAKSTRDILLQTPHLEAATQFYRDMLGFRVFLSTPDLVGLDAGIFRLFLDRAGSLGPVFEFCVRDVSEARRRLLDQGCVVVCDQPEMQRLYLRDPFGLLFHLQVDPHAPDIDDAEPIREPEKPPHY